MITITELNKEQFKGKEYRTTVHSYRFLSIEPSEEGFRLEWKKTDSDLCMMLEDTIMADWLDNPVAFGAYDGDILLGFVEGYLEEWNNRFRITNICVFENELRNKGVGTLLLNKMLEHARKSGARMAILETQSYNSNAISFYKKNGFEIIGFDRFAYSNNGPEEHNILIYMGKKF